MKYYYRIVLFIAILLLLNGSCFSAFQYLDVGARPLGLSGAYSCIGDDASVGVWNPAGFSKIERKEVTTMYSVFYPDLVDNLGLSFVSFVYPLKNIGNIGLGIIEMGTGIYKENVVALTYARKMPFLNNISLGLNVKNMLKKYSSTGYTELDPTFANGMSASGFGLDIGLIYALNEKFSFSAVGKNVNEPDIHLLDQDIVPSQYTIGAAYKYNELVVIEGDFVTYDKGANNNLCVAAEIRLPGDKIGLRTGLSIGNDDYRQLSLGAGYKLPLGCSILQIDYAFVYNMSFSQSPGNHYFSLGIKF